MNVLNQEQGKNWVMYNGDCCEVIKGLPDNSVDYSIFSPPFASLYTYSNSDRDMGNSTSDKQFYKHFRYLVKELYRVIKNGRCVSVHCMDLPKSKERDGIIGLKDFPSIITRTFERAGFVKHSEVCIWKNPVVAMQRTKAIGLLHKQLNKDSSISRQGIPDKLITFRKPGDNTEPIAGLLDYYNGTDEKPTGIDINGEFSPTKQSIEIWQKYASPVWMDIKPSDTLQFRNARDDKDERHICPLQLGVIERGLQLWSNPNDIIFSPFGGIASEGWQANKMGRKYIGIELKDSYYKVAVKNLKELENEEETKLFSEEPKSLFNI